ncbi:MAG: hypothetical protein AB9866_21515 [Syntrophobacteraceae bacterium]
MKHVVPTPKDAAELELTNKAMREHSNLMYREVVELVEKHGLMPIASPIIVAAAVQLEAERQLLDKRPDYDRMKKLLYSMAEAIATAQLMPTNRPTLISLYEPIQKAFSEYLLLREEKKMRDEKVHDCPAVAGQVMLDNYDKLKNLYNEGPSPSFLDPAALEIVNAYQLPSLMAIHFRQGVAAILAEEAPKETIFSNMVNFHARGLKIRSKSLMLDFEKRAKVAFDQYLATKRQDAGHPAAKKSWVTHASVSLN